MDVNSSNLTLQQNQNWTLGSCSTYYLVIRLGLEIIFVVFSFPANAVVMMELLKRRYKRRNDRSTSSTSSLSEAFLLQVSFINICYCVYVLMILLDGLDVLRVSPPFLYALYTPSFTALPVFLVAICVDCYGAVVYPVAYMAVKKLPHRVALCIVPVWLYSLFVWLTDVVYKYSYFHPVCMLSLYFSLPAVVFFSISTLRVLYSASAGSSSQTSNHAKRRASRIILSILLGMVMHYVPQVLFFTYRFIIPTDSVTFYCAEVPLVMVLPMLCKFVAPFLFLYCVGKLGGTSCSTKT